MKKYLLKAEVEGHTKMALMEMASSEKRSLKRQVEYILEQGAKEYLFNQRMKGISHDKKENNS